MSREVRPFMGSFNGHAKGHDCKECTAARLASFRIWYAQQSQLPKMPDTTRTVFVRPHWRRQPNHLKKLPGFKKALIRAFL